MRSNERGQKRRYGQGEFQDRLIEEIFPKSYTPKQMEDTIIKLLEQWQRKREKSMER